MHSLVLVVGQNVRRQLQPFSDYTKVEPYRVYVGDDELAMMTDRFSLPIQDLDALAAMMPEWRECEAEIHQGRLSCWSRENPNGKFDWYKIGGRFSGYLQLKQPRTPALLGRLFGKAPTDRVNEALKREVVTGAILAEPPSAVLSGGAWIEQAWSTDAPTADQWRQTFAEVFQLLPDHAQLTVVDVHS